MQYGFYFDQTRCTGCFTCVIACKDWHECELGSDPASWIHVNEIEKGKYPHPFLAFTFETCYHCERPACVEACPAGAISKRAEDGVVVVDREACLGHDNCGAFCQSACPYGSPQFGKESDQKMQKCGLCLDRWAEGKKPICVDACPMRALDAGPIEELRVKYGTINDAEGISYSNESRPSVVFKPKRYK